MWAHFRLRRKLRRIGSSAVRPRFAPKRPKGASIIPMTGFTLEQRHSTKREARGLIKVSVLRHNFVMKVWMLPEKVLYYFLYFCLMSFLGWIIETVYRSVREKRWVNPGFLYGPFLPIYGFGAVIITFINAELGTLPPVAAWAITLLSPTLLEYIGGCVMEGIFGLKLWDYRGRFLNIQGRICLRFSVYWALCAILLITVIQPTVWTRIDIAGIYLSYFAAGCFFAYLAIDIFRSARSLLNFKAFRNDIAALIAKGKAYQPVFDLRFDKNMRLKLPPEILRIMRPLSSFPAVRVEFAKNLHAFPEKIKQELEKRLWHLPRER
jgi:uncharacterized membrane protein